MTHFAELLRVLGKGQVEFILDALIRSKKAVGRPKDFEAIAELERLQERH